MAVLKVTDQTGKVLTLGCFTSVHWGLGYGVQALYTLGRYAAGDQVYVDQDVVRVSCSGWRTLEHGAHTIGVPRLQDLLKFKSVSLALHSRANPDKPFAQIREAKPLGYNTGVEARTASTIGINFQGIYVDELDGANAQQSAEDASAPAFIPA
jgi:hypothetical protein